VVLVTGFYKINHVLKLEPAETKQKTIFTLNQLYTNIIRFQLNTSLLLKLNTVLPTVDINFFLWSSRKV
jgi:hypothetical protein